jgi:hypothetical protein
MQMQLVTWQCAGLLLTPQQRAPRATCLTKSSSRRNDFIFVCANCGSYVKVSPLPEQPVICSMYHWVHANTLSVTPHMARALHAPGIGSSPLHEAAMARKPAVNHIPRIATRDDRASSCDTMVVPGLDRARRIPLQPIWGSISPTDATLCRV